MSFPLGIEILAKPKKQKKKEREKEDSIDPDFFESKIDRDFMRGRQDRGIILGKRNQDDINILNDGGKKQYAK